MLVEDFCEAVEDRIDEDRQGDARLMLILNNSDVFKKITADKGLSKRFAETIKNAKEAGAFLVLTPVENQTVGFNASEVLKVLKEERQAVWFGQSSLF